MMSNLDKINIFGFDSLPDFGFKIPLDLPDNSFEIHDLLTPILRFFFQFSKIKS